MKIKIHLQTGGRSHAVAAMVSTYVLPAAAEVPETRKEENIYANLSKETEKSRGSIFVNGYELSRKTNIVDYGNYTALRNLTSSSEIRNQDGRIETSADREILLSGVILPIMICRGLSVSIMS